MGVRQINESIVIAEVKFLSKDSFKVYSPLVAESSIPLTVADIANVIKNNGRPTKKKYSPRCVL